MYMAKYPAVAQCGLTVIELYIAYIYSEYPAVGASVGHGGKPGGMVGAWGEW